MISELTEQQRQALHEHPDAPVVFVDPRTNSRYMLIPAAAYERLRTLLEDDEFHLEEAYPAMNEIAGREGWNDPAMSSYDRLDPRRKR